MSRKKQDDDLGIKLGGHLSTEEGLRYVVLKSRALNYNVVQIMVGESRSYKPYVITDKAAQEFRTMSFGISLYVHLPYIINPCEMEPRRAGWYRSVYRQFTNVAIQLGAKGVVLHPGYKKDLDAGQAYMNACRWVEKVLPEDEPLDLLLETDSGSKNGSAVGTPEFISNMIKDTEHPRLHMCLDTTHMYARGTDLWDPAEMASFLETYGKQIKLVHLNVPDLDVGLGSFRDRHNIPFTDRDGWNHENLVLPLIARYPCVLERRSLSVQEQDVSYIRELLTQKT